MVRSDWFSGFLVAVAAGCVGYVELHSTEPTVTVAMITLASACAGYAKRRLFWLSGLVLGGAVPAAYAIAALAHLTPREWPQPEGVLTNVSVGAFTIVAGVLAAACGATMARITARTGLH